MDQASILIVHPDPLIQRTAQRVLGSTGHPVTVASPAQALGRIPELAPRLVLFDPQAMPASNLGALVAAARDHGGTACATSLGAHTEHVLELLGTAGVTNLLVHPMPVFGEELRVTALKLIRGDVFGAEKYLLWGTQLYATTLSRSAQRAEVVEELASEVQRLGQSARAASMAMLVTDELLSNAIHHAPIDDNGVHYRADLARGRDLPLDGRHAVTLRWGCDGRYLAIEVADQFGSLTPEAVLRSVVQRDVRDTGEGAGMGIALTYRSSDHLVFNLAPGRRSEVIALIDVRYLANERTPASSFNVFVERSR